MTDNTQPEALMQLADDYAEASFDQGLHKRTLDDAPENARSVLAAAVRRQHARIAELEAQLEALSAAPVEVADAMADSQYLAGVSAGWNAANADDPNETLRKLHESRAGYLKPLDAARKQGASHDKT